MARRPGHPNRVKWKKNGAGKSTFCDLARSLFGQQNTAIRSNVDNMTSRYHRFATSCGAGIPAFVIDVKSLMGLIGPRISGIVQGFCQGERYVARQFAGHPHDGRGAPTND